eukprot:9124243-Lingulodinium_polyedra.AAC.1
MRILRPWSLLPTGSPALGQSASDRRGAAQCKTPWRPHGLRRDRNRGAASATLLPAHTAALAAAAFRQLGAWPRGR